MATYKRLIIDGNNMAHRMRHAYKSLFTVKGYPTGVLYGTLTAIKKLHDQLSSNEIVFVWDGPHGTKWRKEFSGDTYKGKRHVPKEQMDPEDLQELEWFFSKQLPDVKEALRGLGIPQVEVSGLEADDMIAHMVDHGGSLMVEDIVVSTDKDFIQLVSDTTRVYNPIKEVFYHYTRDERTMKSGIFFGSDYVAPCPRSALIQKAVAGDPSDNLSGIRGIGAVRSFKVFDRAFHENETFEHYFRDCVARNATMKSLAPLTAPEAWPLCMFNLIMADLRFEYCHKRAVYVDNTLNPLEDEARTLDAYRDQLRINAAAFLVGNPKNPLSTGFQFFHQRELKFMYQVERSGSFYSDLRRMFKNSRATT